ncbi:hypothetical protein CRG98_047439 [Punica granatum]|uniref:Uncharacterized protein n=1 Tax=Punica granatum TaxID=22663 RepID=A0A2I0HL24_PUNGR|nr:hypothetical protein CRG98_047439 [Punica granatum]
MLTRASLLSRYASSPSQLARASFDLAGPAHLCEFTFMLLRRDYGLVLLATLPGLLTRASLLSCFVSSPRLRARSSCDLAGSAHPREFTFMLLRRDYGLVLLATLPGLLTRASLLLRFASTRSLRARASYNLAGSAQPCELTFILCKIAETTGSFFLRTCPVSSPVLVYFHAKQVRGACSPVLLTTLPGLLTRASLLSCFASSPSLLGRTSCDLARYAHPREFTFMLRKFTEPARSYFMRPGPICSPARVYFHASQVHRACSVVLHATWPDMLTRASLLSCFASSPSLLGRTSCDLARYAHPREFTFMLRKFTEPARSYFMRPGPICSPARVYFHASQVHRACSVVLHATWPDMLTRASLLSCFASSPSLLGRTSCDLARYAHPREFTFMLRKFTEPARSYFMRPGPICSPARVYFHASQVHRACSVVLHATWPDMLTRASLLSCFASSPSLLGRTSCDLARYAHPREFTFMLRKFTEPARSYFMRPGPICSPARVYFHASQVHRACSVVLHATWPDMLTRASLLSCFASSPSLLGRTSCDLARYAHPREFTFMLRKFTEPARSYFMRPGPICSPARVYFHASQVHRACSVVLHATWPDMLTRASLLSCFASSPSLLGRTSCDLARYAHPREFTFMLRKFTEPARSYFMRPGPICSPARVYFHASQVHRACSVVLHATWPDMLTRASLLSCFASSPSLLGRTSCDLARYAHPREFTFMLRKFTEPARSYFMRPGPICSPARVYFHASQVHRACSVVLHATWPDMLTRASLLSCFASSPSLLGRTSCDLARYAHPREFTFMLRKFTEPARSYFMRPGPICSPARVYFHASQVHRACSVVLHATWPDMLTRASLLSCFASSPSLLGRTSCDLARYAHPREFTFMLRKFTEPARSYFMRPGPICSPARVYFHASQVHRACSVVLHATWPDMLTRASLLSCFASSPSLLGRASCDLARYAHPCEFTFMIPKFAETAGSFFLRPCRVCSPVQVYCHASQVRGACSIMLLATLPGLLTLASLLSYFASSHRLRARSSCDLSWSAHPCEFTFKLRKYAEPPRSCFLQPCRVGSPVRVYFHAS